MIDADDAFFSLPDDDQWTTYEVPREPQLIFLDSYYHTRELLAEHGDNGAHLVNRMVFAHLLGALEAYLGDTLINKAMSDDSAIRRMIAADAELKKEKFNLAEILSDPGIVKSRVKRYLRSVRYHNLPKVRFLYKVVFDVDIFDVLGLDGKTAMLKAVEYRHDCVHRNGFDKDGKRLDVFTQKYIHETAATMRALVDKIENAAKPRLDDEIPF